MEINKPVTTVLIIIAALLVVFLFVVPKYQESNDLENMLAAKQAQYSSESQYYDNVLKVFNQLQTHQDEIAKIDNALPQTFSYAELIYFLNQTGTANNFEVQSIDFGSIPPSDPTNQQVKTIQMSINASSSYDGLKKFLYALENSSKIFEVNNITFSGSNAVTSSSKTGQQSTVVPLNNYKLDLKTYSY